MEKEEFELIERKLNIILPHAYKNALQNNPIIDKKKYYNVYMSLLYTANEIIDINLELRKHGFKNKVWYDHMFIIGVDGNNCFFFLNLKDQISSRIYYLTNKDRYNPDRIEKYLTFRDFNEFFWNRITLQSISGFGE